MGYRCGDVGQFCKVRTSNDVGWVAARVLLGDRVVVRAGGLRRPRRHGMGATKALRSIGYQLTAIGGELHIGYTTNRARRLLRGSTALAQPRSDDGGDGAGVREPRQPSPTTPHAANAIPLT